MVLSHSLAVVVGGIIVLAVGFSSTFVSWRTTSQSNPLNESLVNGLNFVNCLTMSQPFSSPPLERFPLSPPFKANIPSSLSAPASRAAPSFVRAFLTVLCSLTHFHSCRHPPSLADSDDNRTWQRAGPASNRLNKLNIIVCIFS